MPEGKHDELVEHYVCVVLLCVCDELSVRGLSSVNCYREQQSCVSPRGNCHEVD
jgi:hypothetical protein